MDLKEKRVPRDVFSRFVCACFLLLPLFWLVLVKEIDAPTSNLELPVSIDIYLSIVN